MDLYIACTCSLIFSSSSLDKIDLESELRKGSSLLCLGDDESHLLECEVI